MLASIHPLGERARHSTWAVTVTAYVAGSALAGALLGAALGVAGDLGKEALPPWRLPGGFPFLPLLAAVLACAAAAWSDARGPGRLWPTLRRQVDDRWLTRYRGWVYGGGFGLQLGLGVVTIVTTATVHATWLLALLSGSALGGATVGLTFGVTRALPLVALAAVDHPEQLWRFHRRMQAGDAPVRRGAVTVLLVLAVAASVGSVAAR
jgi:hypothetical protein